MVHKISTRFDDEMLSYFINACNDLIVDDVMTIYLKSVGGDTWVMQVILDIINNHPTKFFLIAVDEISSCAFELFMRAHCDKEILFACTGMYHQTFFHGVNLRMDNSNDLTIAEKDYQKIRLEEAHQFCENIGFTKKELKDFLLGKDVLFTYHRMLKFLEPKV